MAVIVTEPVGWHSAELDRRDLAARFCRLEWSWLAEADNQGVGRALWWGLPGSEYPLALAAIMGEEPDGVPSYTLVLAEGWRADPAASAAVSWRQQAARRIGLTDELERLRFEWNPAAGLPPIDAVTANPRFAHLRPGLSGASHTLLKPFAWQGDMCIGPMRDGQLTFQACETSPRWTGLPFLDEAGPRAVLAYLAGYGPTTRANLHYWLVAGLSAGRRRLDGWLDELIGDRVVKIEVDGEPLLHLHEYADDLAAHSPDDGVTLLPGHDQWVLGAGTADARIVPPGRRASVTRGANLVLRAGVVSGTWTIAKSHLAISWFSEAGNPQPARLETEAHRLAGLLGADLNVSIAIS